MAIWFVSRHPGAIEWVARQSIQIDRAVDHLDVSAVVSGDSVIGTLPIHMAAAICERGARYFHLEISIPRELRGQELDAGQLLALGARLTEFQVRRWFPTASQPNQHDLGGEHSDIDLQSPEWRRAADHHAESFRPCNIANQG